MSKKNSRTRRASQLKFDRQRTCETNVRFNTQPCNTGEKQQQERLGKAAQSSTAAPKPGKRKSIRLRKNMVVRVRVLVNTPCKGGQPPCRCQGIKIKDSDSKKQALALLKAEQVNKMDVDGERVVLVRGSKATKAARAVRAKGGVQKKQGKAVAMMLD